MFGTLLDFNNDEIDEHYAAFVEPCVKGLGYCVRYDVGWAWGGIMDGEAPGALRRFPTWMAAYDSAVQVFSDPSHPASRNG